MKDYKKILKGVVNIIATTEKTDIGFANICSYLSDNCDELFESIEDAKDVSGNTKAEHLIPQKGMYYTCIKDYYSSDNTHLCVKGNVYKSSFNGYIDDESHFGLSWTNSCAEKYFEPTKDEAWIVCEHDNVIGKPMQYKEFKKKVNQKFIENLKAEGITPKLRIWTVKDAKDGDILSTLAGAFIYNGNNGGGSCPGCYCGINTLGNFEIGTEHHWTTKTVFPELQESEDEKIRKSIIENLKGNMYRADGDYDLLNKQIAWLEKQGEKPQGKTALEAVEEEKVDNANKVKPKFHEDEWIVWQDKCCKEVYPATKEQCDKLLKAMADAGYEWDANKKELKKIEKPTAWSQEDERMMLSIEQIMNCASLLNIVPQKIDKVRTWLKSIKERIGE